MPAAVPEAILEGLPADGWIVGGAIRDGLLGRQFGDVDVIVPGSPERAARAFAERVGGCAVFGLNDQFGAWRVIHHSERWQADFTPLVGESLEQDLAARDFTVNAIARPVAGGDPVDPCGGIADLQARTLRAVGPSSFSSDPLRVMRMTRLEMELGFRADPGTATLAAESAARLAEIAGERAFTEFSRILSGDDPVEGIRRLDASGALAAIIPELPRLKGVEQSDYHHLDCWEHTLLVVEEVVRLESNPARLGPAGPAACRLLTEELADGLERRHALRIAALLHDVAKPETRTVHENGRVGFPDHDRAGERISGEILARFKTSAKLAGAVRAEVLDHLTAGFMTHRDDFSARDEWEYLERTAPVSVDVTVLSVADRLATLGRKSEEAVSRHLALTDRLLAAAVRLEQDGLPAPLIRGDALAVELGIDQGPILGELLGEIAAARYAGEVEDAKGAVELAAAVLAERGRQ